MTLWTREDTENWKKKH